MTITRETIEGRTATVTFINDDFVPVEPDDATLIKIIFDDGEIRFGVKSAQDRLKSQFRSEKRRAQALLEKHGDHDQSTHGNWAHGGGGGEESSGGGDSARRKGETDKEFAKRVVDKRPVPKEMPEKHSDYFKNMDGPKTETIPLDKLVSSKTAAENKKGAENGAKRMVAGKNGEIAKRDPINAEPIGNGKYLITDGNGTYSAVKMYDWKAIPVNVDASGTAESLANLASLKTDVGGGGDMGRVGLKAKGKEDAEVHRDKVWVANSPIKTEQQAIEAALVAQLNFQAKAGEIAKRLGVKFENPGSKVHRVKTELVNGERETVRDANGDPIYVKDANGNAHLRLSGVERLTEKAEKYAKKGMGPARVTDLARGGFVPERPEDAQKIMNELAKHFELVDEGWATKPSTYYTDRVALFRDPATGMIGEIQISQPAMLRAKQEGGGHKIYKKSEDVAAAMTDARNAGDTAAVKAHQAEYDRLNAQMRDLYGRALDGLSPEWRKLIDKR